MKQPKVFPNFYISDLTSFTDRFTKVYKLLRNIYGLKDSGRTWFDFLKKGLIERGWSPSEIDPCLFNKNGILLIFYVDDSILISPHKYLIDFEINSLWEYFDLTDDGEIKDYLGTRFTKRKGRSIELSQPHMVSRIL